jgi:gallate dioxygenase
MAKIIGAIATSHSIGFALDKQKQDEPAWAPICEAYRPVRRWLEQKEARRPVFDL